MCVVNDVVNQNSNSLVELDQLKRINSKTNAKVKEITSNENKLLLKKKKNFEPKLCDTNSKFN